MQQFICWIVSNFGVAAQRRNTIRHPITGLEVGDTVADTLNDTNNLELSVYANDEQQQAWLIARLDNLGKGASGAAVQNMNLALGLPEDSGL